MTEEIDKLQVEDLRPEIKEREQMKFIEQFMLAQGRKFRRKFVKESFSERFKKHINTK